MVNGNFKTSRMSDGSERVNSIRNLATRASRISFDLLPSNELNIEN